MALAVTRLPSPPPEAPQPQAPAPAGWADPVALTNLPWQVLVDRERRGGAGETSPLQERFRLAGTFFLYREQGQGDRKAILDDLRENTQHLVGEQDRVGEVRVARIHRDHILLESGSESAELWLSFRDLDRGDEEETASAKPDRPTRFVDMPALSTNRFGKRIGENRWVMKRERLMDYYHELLDEPARMAGLFMSMKPVYAEDESIGGYRVDMEAENAFFEEVGLKEGDVVRRVNSMRMVSQNRAEYFIREFVQERLNAVVLDVERGGEEQKLIYLVR